MSADKKKNYRMSRRVPVYFPAIFKSGDMDTEGMVVQVSQGGILFHCPEEIDVKSRGTFCLKAFPNEPDLDVEGEVVYRLYDREVENRGGMIKYGICFLEPDNARKEVIDRIIRYATIRERYFNNDSDHTEA